MARLVISAVILAFCGLLVALNLGTKISFNLPGISFENVSVMTILGLGFAAGILFSLYTQLRGYLRRKTKLGLARRGEALGARESLVSAREAKADIKDEKVVAT